jgi:hypothetical protein
VKLVGDVYEMILSASWKFELPGFLGLYNRGFVKLVSCVEYEAKDLQMQ